MSLSFPKLNVTQASVLSFATLVITQVIAFVPSLAPYKADAISTAGIVISAVFLAVHAVHAVIDLVRELLKSKVTPEEVRQAAVDYGRQAVHNELSQVDLNQLAADAVSGKTNELQQTAEELVQQAVDKIFAPFRQQTSASDVQPAQGGTPEPARIVSLVPPLPEQTPPPAAPTPSTTNA